MLTPSSLDWLWPMLVGAVAGFLVAWAVAYASRWSRRLREDGDPGNDWLADVLDSAVEAARRGDAAAWADEMEKVRAELRARERDRGR